MTRKYIQPLPEIQMNIVVTITPALSVERLMKVLINMESRLSMLSIIINFDLIRRLVQFQTFFVERDGSRMQDMKSKFHTQDSLFPFNVSSVLTHCFNRLCTHNQISSKITVCKFKLGDLFHAVALKIHQRPIFCIQAILISATLTSIDVIGCQSGTTVNTSQKIGQSDIRLEDR